MRKKLSANWVVPWLMAWLLLGPRTGEGIGINQFPGVSAPSLISPSQTNAPTSLRNAQKLSLAEWFRQQVAIRKLNPATPQAVAAKSGMRRTAIQKLQESVGSKVKVALRKNGTPSQIKGAVLAHRSAKAIAGRIQNFEETARSFARDNHALLSLQDSDSELALEKAEADILGRQHLLFSQKHKDLRVWPCEIRIHLDKEGNVDLMEGAYIPTPVGLPDSATVSAEQAVRFATKQLAPGGSVETTQAELIIYGPLEGVPRLAWKFNLSASLMRAWRCIVDAGDGSVLLADSLVADLTATGSGVDGLGKARPLHLWQDRGLNYMVDTSKAMYNAASTPPIVSNILGGILIFDAMNTPPNDNPDLSVVQVALGASTSATSGWVPDTVGAAFGLSETYDYYLTRHSRNSLDGEGGSINGIVRVGLNFRNAFWQGQLKVMIFGDGFPSALDVCAHELTHGVVNTIANGQGLIYQNQSGALNEGFADIFGKSVEARTTGINDWSIGGNTPLGVVRDMKNPGSLQSGAGPFPSKMSEFIQLSTQQDSGGVHINSSIINHTFYLLVEGLDGAIGRPDAERIFYRALTMHVQPQSQFIDARHACVSAAEELFGVDSAQALKTAQAFDAVEIVDAPTTPEPSPVPSVSAPDSTLCLNWDGTGYRLIRRESAQGDFNNGVFLNTIKYLAHERVSVSGDGSFAIFVTEDHDYGIVNTDGKSPEVGGNPGLVHSLAMTPDGKKLALILLDPSGNPSNEIQLIDLVTSDVRTIKLYATSNDGKPQDIIDYADVLDFTSDGRTLIYDAYAETAAGSGGNFAGWTLYALDLATTNITPLLQLNSAFDFGNPAVGKAKNNLITFEAIERQTGISSILAADIANGTLGYIGQAGTAGSIGYPDYTGDDRSIIYSQRDFFQFTGYDLVLQPLAVDGVTASGPAVSWFLNCDVVSMYRRGTFIGSNSLPAITLKSPADAQVFTPPASIIIQATASDSDGGSVTNVEFYEGSTKLGQRSSPPYELTWTNIPAGTYHLSVRAIDNLGGATDSRQVSVIVANPPRFTNTRWLNPNVLQLTLAGDVGTSYVIQQSSNLANWSTLETITNVTGTVTVQDSGVSGQPHRFYRALLR